MERLGMSGAAARPVAGGSGEAPPRLVVVGGGIAGLAAAHRVVERCGQRGIDLVLLEAGERLGGVFATGRESGFLYEMGPDSFVTDKPWAVDLCRRVGLGDELIPTNDAFRRTLVVRDGRLIPLPDAFQLLAPARLLPFLRSPVLSLRGKLGALRDLVAPRGGPAEGEDESLASFVRRRLGNEMLERIAQPMIGGIYTADPETLSLRATMPRFLEMERRRRSVILALRDQPQSARSSGTSGARFGLFVTLRRGLSSLVDAIGARLPAGSVRLRSRALRLTRPAPGSAPAGRTWRIEVEGGDVLDADGVVLATPAAATARLLQSIDPEAAEQLRRIPYASAAVVSLGFRRGDLPAPPDAFGIVVPEVERRRIIACSFSSVKYEGRAPHDAVLLRVFVGGAMHPELFALGEDEILRVAREELRSLLGIEAEPILQRVGRWPESMPQYLVGHAQRAARILESVAQRPRLALAGNAYTGVGIADCVRTGEAAADAVLAGIERECGGAVLRGGGS
jgi:protoporphyrinogen/coproporphyrinogen III oxidase